MAVYHFTGNYTREAIQAMIDNPQDRGAAATAMIEAAGGKMLCCYAALGSFDIVAICEMPDDTDVAAISMVVGGSGVLTNCTTTRLLSMDQFTEAMGKAGQVAGGYKRPQG